MYHPSRDRGTARLANSELQFQQWRAQVVVAPSSRGSAEPEARRFFGACVRVCVPRVCGLRRLEQDSGSPRQDVSDTGSARCCRIFFGLSADGARRGGEEGGRFGDLPRIEKHGSGSRYGFLFFFWSSENNRFGVWKKFQPQVVVVVKEKRKICWRSSDDGRRLSLKCVCVCVRARVCGCDYGVPEIQRKPLILGKDPETGIPLRLKRKSFFTRYLG